MQNAKLLRLIREACEDKKAEEIVTLDLKKNNGIADYFVICSGNSERHVHAIAENVADSLIKEKVRYRHFEGKQNSQWVLLDYVDVIVHVFHHETRKFYNLERLWGDAKIVK